MIRSPLLPLPLKKIKFFIYGAILLKFEKKNMHMFANIATPTPLSPVKKSQIFIHGAISLKFETEYFHMFTNINSH